MKKVAKISLALLACLMITVILPSCGESKIKSVTISGKTYVNVYLYEIDAEMLKVSSYASEGYNPLKDYHYALSTVVREAGSVYTKGGTVIFAVAPETRFSSEESAKFTVKKKIKEYGISVKENKDTYTITYYTIGAECCGKDKNDLIDYSLRKNTVEVAKDKVTITYK